ncbi:MAG TPA: endonuclease/exonuclease/phosphatase family protein [Thermoanaerobaculia bacterium]
MSSVPGPQGIPIDAAFAPPARVRAMSYNIRGQAALYGSAHLERIANVIAAAQPDVVALQEVHRETWKSRFRDQLTELAERTGMRAAFGSSIDLGRGRYGNAVLTRGEILHSVVHPLPGGGEARTVLETLVQIGGDALTVYSTHLAAWGRWGRRTRLRQAARAARLARRSRLPFILAGDFNSEPSSRELAWFAKDTRLISCFAAASATHRVTRQCLDYIFVDRRWEIEDARVIAEGPSDHWPIVAELRWRNEGEE